RLRCTCVLGHSSTTRLCSNDTKSTVPFFFQAADGIRDDLVTGVQTCALPILSDSFIMTLSDMSTVTAEVKVDETDIVSVKLGQDGDVNIDAIPGKVFKGKVTEVGSQAVLRSSGLTTTQTTNSKQQPKDCRVGGTQEDPHD